MTVLEDTAFLELVLRSEVREKFALLVFVTSIFLLAICFYQILVDRLDIVAWTLFALLSSIAFVNFVRQLFYFIDSQIGNAFLLLALSNLSKSSDSDQERCLANSLLVLVRKKL